MSRLLSRIMLAFLMLPLASMLYLITVLVFDDGNWVRSTELELFFANLITATFVAVYWILLWRSTVRWTGSRIRLSLLAVVAWALGGLVVGVLGAPVDEDFGALIGGTFTITTCASVHRPRYAVIRRPAYCEGRSV